MQLGKKFIKYSSKFLKAYAALAMEDETLSLLLDLDAASFSRSVDKLAKEKMDTSTNDGDFKGKSKVELVPSREERQCAFMEESARVPEPVHQDLVSTDFVCVICAELMSEPRTLPCAARHMACNSCLNRW